MTIIAPSLYSADFANLKKDVERFNESKAQWLHYDVMDGQFVPNITFGPVVLKQVNKLTDRFIDVHIMVYNPSRIVDQFDGCRIDMMTFHLEAVNSLEEGYQVIEKIKSKGYQVGISIKPNTAVEELIPYLGKVDMVLIMSVEPGFGGQKFNGEVMSKGDWLFDYREEHHLNFLLQVDGGINKETAVIAKQHHFNVLVAGSYCFGNKDFSGAVESIM